MIPSEEEVVKAIFARSEVKGFSLTRFRSRVIQAVPNNRTVVEYTFQDRRLIGKFYTDDSGKKVYRVLKQLRAAESSTSPHSVLAVPEPLFYDANLNLLLQYYVPGTPYFDLVNRPGYRRYLRFAGSALATVHCSKVSAERRKGIQHHLKDLIHPHPAELMERLPREQARIRSLLEIIERKSKQWEEKAEVCLLHRDYHLRQLFYQRGVVWVIDWDLHAKGDPALDVGNFLVYLETHLKEPSSHKDAFLKGYSLRRRVPTQDRLWLYKGFAYLRLACKRFRLGCGIKVVSKMLHESENCLTRV